MSSTTQTAENCIASGLTFNIDDIEITAPKLNKSGGKSANILYKPSKKGLYVNLTVPMLTWGASMFKDPQSGKETYDMAIQFPRKDYSTPETDILLARFQEFEKYIKNEAVKNSMLWFNRKMTPELIDAAWTPMLKYSKDKETGEADMTKTPTLKVKLPCWDGKFNCEIYNPQGTILYPDEETGLTPLELIPNGANIVAIIQCGGLWFANKAFGCTWRLFQTVVYPKPTMKGKCWINVMPVAATATATTKATLDVAPTTNETIVVVEDDTDSANETEQTDFEEPISKLLIQTSATAPTAVQTPAPAPTAVQTPAVESTVVKKKVVRKKD